MVAGATHYIEASMIETGGGDFFTVAVEYKPASDPDQTHPQLSRAQ